MLELLSASPLLAIFIVLTLGALFGAIPFGPLKFGAAGALFIGLAVGAFAPELGQQMGLVQALGLALFVYMVGIAAGQTFFTDAKRQSMLMIGAVVILVVVAIVVALVGDLLGVDIAIVSGVYSGSLTSTPPLATATDLAGNELPGVGYALGYPVGVLFAIIGVSLVAHRPWAAKNDSASHAGEKLFATTCVVENPMSVREVPGWADQKVRMSYLQRGDTTRVVVPGEDLLEGDRVVVVGMEEDVRATISHLGRELEKHLADDRSTVEFQSFVISNKQLAGRRVGELNLPARYGGLVTRIHRNDLELLAGDDEVLQIGDVVQVAYPRHAQEQIRQFFGDSMINVTKVDALGIGIGMSLGLLLGMIDISLPGDIHFSLGAAAGPLVVGMILGYLQRTGPLVWQLPMVVNQTLRQIGLLLFLATVGIASGPAFADQAFSVVGAKTILLGVLVAVVTFAATALLGKVSGLSAPRTAGAIAGIFGQPAVLSHAESLVNDERIESGYAALFALGIVVKILVMPLIFALG